MTDTQTTALPNAPARPDDAHKGTFGTVVVIGGSIGMIGAPALTAGAALRSGCGLARIATDPALIHHVLTIEPSATGWPLALQGDQRDAAVLLDRLASIDDVLAIGPGMGTGDGQRDFIEEVLRQPRRIILDADGLNTLAELPDPATLPRCPLIMTPHPGEFNRLAAAAGLRGDPTDPDQRPAACRAMAVAFDAVVVLKGRHTVVSNQEQHYIATTGNPALATAGTGDVLTGIIAGLLAQGMELFDAAVLGVHLHGLAADLWAKQFGHAGLTARDLINLIPQALQHHRAHST